MLKPCAIGDIKKPALVFFHGFLGSNEDWKEIIDRLKEQFFCVTISLDHVAAVQQTLKKLSLHQPIYVGYSMGGRLALQLPAIHPCIIMSAHFGLDTAEERLKRWHQDLQWIEKLKNEPIEHFVQQWYAQPLFDPLRKKQSLFKEIVQKRVKQDPEYHATLLYNLSLSKQNKITYFHPQTLFLFGEDDWKYEEHYSRLPHNVLKQKIPNSGHVIHLENPEGCAKAILTWSKEHGYS